jgi:hypothetical protein
MGIERLKNTGKPVLRMTEGTYVRADLLVEEIGLDFDVDFLTHLMECDTCSVDVTHCCGRSAPQLCEAYFRQTHHGFSEPEWDMWEAYARELRMKFEHPEWYAKMVAAREAKEAEHEYFASRGLLP